MKNDWTKMGAFALGMTLALLFAPCLPASAQTIPGCMQTDLQDLANNISVFRSHDHLGNTHVRTLDDHHVLRCDR